MKLEFTARARKQLALLQENLRHPSLQAKKYDDGRDVWQGRVNWDYRFYFQILGDTYRILALIPHPK
jgi:mRNA interferase RelE/StbE